MTGKRGFATQPETIAKFKGTYRKDRYKKDNEKIEGLAYLDHVPDPPEYLNKVGTEFWNTNLTYLIQFDGLMTELDLPIFSEFCYNYQTIHECNIEISLSGPILKDSKGRQYINPYWKIYRDALKTFNLLSRLFGMNPSSRSHLKFENKESELDDLNGLEI